MTGEPRDTTRDATGGGSAAETPRAIDPEALSVRLAKGDPLVVLDVREGWEVEIAALEGSTHIPMAEVPRRHSEL
ncbi:MAG: hypothetical protein ACKORK_00935, partial [Gemmatimonadota bacterium]